ncbi:MAG: S8 family serine peptidase, partial [Ignavibacteria bacterium]
SNRLKAINIFDEKDIPVYVKYIEELTSAGIHIRSRSKWLNAVSCFANNVQIRNVSQMGFVKRIELVQKFSRVNATAMQDNTSTDNSLGNQFDNPSTINYGPSLNQSMLINVPPVHDLGYTGEGILIASFDAGFDNLQHTCFSNMRTKGIRSYDFVNGDTIVANGIGRHGNGAHGTITLSLIAGYDPGSLVSPAFNSQYLLAKTENTETETPLEEDNWIAAAEWADSLGADIITSSLGYKFFDSPYKSYTWEDMDGTTANITLAADIAVERGIIVVCTSGNAGSNPDHNTLSVPGDGFNVITVGAVNSNGTRAGFSSIGPTADNRIKPDVMALGVSNYAARSGSGNFGYSTNSTGTSLACPMVAGVCALILSANPNLTPLQVKDILRNTSDNSSNPGNLKGWGIVNAMSAVELALELGTLNFPGDFVLTQNFPNPFNPSTTFRFSLKKSANVSLIIFDVRGRKLATVIDNVSYTPGNKEISYNFVNSGLSSGVYFYSLIADGSFVDTKKMMLVR